MKIFNTVVSFVLLLAVSYLFVTGNVFSSGDKSVESKLESQGEKGLRIAYINTDSLAEKYKLNKELVTKLEEKAKLMEADLAQKTRVFQENIAVLQQQAASLNEQQLMAAQQDLQRSEQQLMADQEQKSQELMLEKQQIDKLIKEDLDSVLSNVKKEYSLDFILSLDPASILLSANEEYDITDIVIERLNENYTTAKEKMEKASEEEQ